MEIPRCSILVVDDEPSLLKLTESLLASHFEVVLAGSAYEAMDLLQRRGFDIILTDLCMPEMTGIQLLKWVSFHYPRTIRLLITSFPEDIGIGEAINEANIFRVIFRPYKDENLIQQVLQAARLVQLERDREQWQLELEQQVIERTQQLQKANQDLDKKSRELAEAVAKLKISNHTLEELALRDALTGLSNARAMTRIATKELLRNERYPSDLALGFVDIDDFKKINTDYCHTGGDEILRQLAQCLSNGVREVDTVSRQGGDEFLILAPSTNLAGARVLAERIRDAVIKTKFRYRDTIIPVTASIGFIVVPAGEKISFEELKRQASQAVLDAKKKRIKIYIRYMRIDDPGLK